MQAPVCQARANLQLSAVTYAKGFHLAAKRADLRQGELTETFGKFAEGFQVAGGTTTRWGSALPVGPPGRAVDRSAYQQSTLIPETRPPM